METLIVGCYFVFAGLVALWLLYSIIRWKIKSKNRPWNQDPEDYYDD